MASIEPTGMQKFIATLKYEEILVFSPGDLEYERSVATANLLYRYSRPGCVVQPKRNSQVQMIVNHARTRKLTLTIKNGGHSYAGFSTAGAGRPRDLSKSVSLDLSKMNVATLSDDRSFITLQGGCLWGHAYKQLVNRHMNGYAINGGRCPTVGVSGFILGGGLGPFSRSLGMGCDSLLEVTLVTAKGELVRVSDSNEATPREKELFWALRGAGGGNFGVVVELKMRVDTLAHDMVVAGRFEWTPKEGSLNSLVETMRQFYLTDWENTTTIDTSWLQKPDKPLQIRFLYYHNGTDEDFDRAMEENIPDGDLQRRLIRHSLEEKSTRFLHESLVAMWKEEVVKSFPTTREYLLFTSFVFKNDKKTINDVTAIVRAKMDDFNRSFTEEACLLQVSWIHTGGAASTRATEATAFPWREGVYCTYIELEWEAKYLEKDMRQFLREMKKDMQPYSLEGRAAYVNFPDPNNKPTQYERSYYGSNYGRLQKVKKDWDPDNFFDWSQGVKAEDPDPPPPVAGVVDDETDKIAAMRFDEFQPGLLTLGAFPGLDGVPMGGLSGAPMPIGLSDLGF